MSFGFDVFLITGTRRTLHHAHQSGRRMLVSEACNTDQAKFREEYTDETSARKVAKRECRRCWPASKEEET